MTNASDATFCKSNILTETFYAEGDVVDESYVNNLEKLVYEANQDLLHGQFFVNKNTDKKTVVICASLDVMDIGMPNLDTDHYRKLVAFLYYTTRGLVMTLNEQLENDKKEVSLREFTKCIISSVIDNTRGLSDVVMLFDKDSIIEDVLSGVDNLDGIMPVDAETYVSEGRLNAFSFILNMNYWQNTCKNAIADIVKEMDAKALRIALPLSMKVL